MCLGLSPNTEHRKPLQQIKKETRKLNLPPELKSSRCSGGVGGDDNDDDGSRSVSSNSDGGNVSDSSSNE